MLRTRQETLLYFGHYSFLPLEYGFISLMLVCRGFSGEVYVNNELERLLIKELRAYRGDGGFLPALKQVANVSALPGIVGKSIGLPDIHAGMLEFG